MVGEIDLHGICGQEPGRECLNGSNAEDRRWAVIYVRGGDETEIIKRAKDLGCELYFAQGKVKRRVGKEYEVVDKPVFQCYMFVTQTGKWLNILQDPSVWYLMMSNDETVNISEAAVNRIKQLEISGAFDAVADFRETEAKQAETQPVVTPFVVQKLARLRNTQPVQVTSGPFKGVDGIVLQSKKHNQVLIEVSGRRILIPRAILAVI